MEDYLNGLNDSQRAAVTYTGGTSLVIAGAGSGKTRVLTCKIAYLLQQGIPPQTILALTFTNKAAKEMKERIAGIVGDAVARRLWMGTFHAVFSRILRSEADRIGYPSNFTIYDSTDSKNLLKAIIKEMQLDDKEYRPGMVQSRISNAKNALVTCHRYEHDRELVDYDIKARIPLLRDIYKRYQSRCLQAGAMDFDDLLLQTNILFRDHSDVLEKYRNFFQYILVDEYQDTNFAQHLIVQRLSEVHGRLTVVGDDAQSIYSFRGANIDNILQLGSKYPNCQTFKLERNYRSTRNIVDAANSLIHKNKEQIPKTVYSENEEGSRIQVFASLSDYEEAHAVASKIEGMQRGNSRYTYADFAILYRTNAQSRLLEEALRKRGIAYKIYGGLSFYQRKEIKDVIAYFRLIVNPHDEEALKRVINYPSRGIGDTTVGKLSETAVSRAVSLWTVLQEPANYGLSVNAGTLRKLTEFRELIAAFTAFAAEHPAEETAEHTVKYSGIYELLMQDRSVEGIGKRENTDELLKGIAEFTHIRREEGSEQTSLSDFLSEVSLLTDQDKDTAEQTDRVTLMTVHSAKGLEFSNVFIAGLEEDLFPSAPAKESPRAIEEERRLLYVALTRAKENCTLSYAKSRFRNGKTTLCNPSRFLRDIDSRFLQMPDDAFSPSLPHSFRPDRPLYQQRQQPQAPSHLQPLPSVPSSSTVPQSPSSDIRLKAGDRVLHDRFGEGEVTAVEGSGGDAKATIRFAHSGEKKILLKFARLTVF
ncbi:ATP-dependent DNA helicase pcrA [Bacteroidales bacterium Barb6XT]|nr:ATP-dependent DNA helicase pcrA [Bacteroidales bacterium Barb6XT]